MTLISRKPIRVRAARKPVSSRCRKRSGLANFRLSVGLPLGVTMLTLRAGGKKLLSLKRPSYGW
jgi:hypothetical protein